MSLDALTWIVCGAVVSLCVQLLISWLRRLVFADIADRETGELRRQAAPPAYDNTQDYIPGSYEIDAAASKALRNERGFFTLRDGRNIFYQSWLPTEEVDAVLVHIHGYGDECDFTTALMAKTLCSIGRFGAVAFDLPGFGRSDGLFAYIPDWFELVDSVREVLVEHIKPLVETWPQRRVPRLKWFAIGESMGGGLVFSMLVREKELFDATVLICPMIFVGKDMYPPWIVLQLFRKLVDVLPLWPLTPKADVSSTQFSDPEMTKFFKSGPSRHSRINQKGKLRLATANTLGFIAGDWMKSKIPEFDTPCLIVHGEADKVTDPAISKALFEGMSATDKRLELSASVWHGDVFFGGPKHYDGCRERFRIVARWIEERSR
mmetsp:Transcript_57746/g.130533  ORF Transcript_57746/g.130533 Transcript_57746/m.130533 type:complete len:377 (+) Transcript_57746:41-1171(+)